MLKKVVSILGLCVLSSCSMAPKIKPIPSPVPEAYPDEVAYEESLILQDAANSESARLSDIAWPHYFQDETLKDLIEKALTQNRSLKQAALDIAEARALYGIERSGYFPAILIDGSYARQDYPANSNNRSNSGERGFSSGGSGPSDFYTASVGVTAYELDLFGRVKSLNDAALRRFFARQSARDAVRISLIADIASTYTTLVTDQALLALTESTLKTQKESLALIELRLNEGISNNLELHQAQILFEQAHADKVALQRAIAEDRNALRLLLGSSVSLPESFESTGADTLEAIAPVIPVGLPSDLLTARPDIQQAEYELVAANADIGAARAAFFPRITLTGSAGFQSIELTDLFDARNQFWRFSPAISIPIFIWGRLANNLELVEVRSEKAVVAYEQAIETAFREVADALAAVSTYDDQLQAQERLIQASENAAALSELRYDEGVENYLSVLDARRERYNAQKGYLRLKAAEITARIQLYKAVGGGRQETLKIEAEEDEDAANHKD